MKRYRRAVAKVLSLAGGAFLASSLLQKLSAQSAPEPERLISSFPEYTADVVVYRDGDYAVAVDRRGNVVARSTDHVEVLQYGLEKADRRVIALGEFEFYKTLYVKSGKELDMAWSEIIPKSDVDLFYIEKNAKLYRVYVDLTQIDTFTKAVFKFHGEQKYGVRHYTRISGFRIVSDGKGTAIHMICENANENISWVTVEDGETEELEYVIKMQCLNTVAPAWINGNRFIDIRDYNSKYMVWIERNTALGVFDSATNKNTFIGLRYQAGDKTTKVIRVQGLNNLFIDCKIWDIGSAPEGAVAIEFDTDAKNTWFEGSVPLDYVVDNGKGNRILTVLDDDIRFVSKSATMNYIRFDSALDVINANVNAQYFLAKYFETVSDYAWAFVVQKYDESYPRFRVATNGTISLGDGANPPNIVIQNVNGKARIYNVDAIQIPYYSDCANIPSTPYFDGHMIVCYDTGAGTYRLKVGIGGAWKDVATFS